MQLSKASGAKKKTSLPQVHSLRLIEFWKLPQPMPTCRPAKHWNAVYKILVLIQLMLNEIFRGSCTVSNTEWKLSLRSSILFSCTSDGINQKPKECYIRIK
jgi:hypothetical protein